MHRLLVLLKLCLLSAIGMALNVNAGENFAAALAETTFTGFAKAMYVADDKKGGRPNQSTLGFGGKLGVETGQFQGFKFKGAWYATTDLGLRSHNLRQTDAYMFDLDKVPYSVLGEVQIDYVAGNTSFTAGRQEFFSPVINSYDYRIIPNLFEGYTLKNRDLPNTTVTLAYVSKMSGLDGLVTFSEFRSLSQQAYTSLLVAADGTANAVTGDTLDVSSIVGQHGVWVAGLAYEKEHHIQFWNFYGVDTLNTWYLDGRLKAHLNKNFTATLDGQAYQVNAVGQFKNYLAQQGLNARYGLLGVKGTLAYQPIGLSVALALNRYSGNRKTVTAFGNWGGYPEFVSMPYMYAENTGNSAIAGSHLSRLTILFDLATCGLRNQSILFGHANINIDEHILASSDITVNTLLYRAQINPSLSARMALEARSSRNARYDNDFVALSLLYNF